MIRKVLKKRIWEVPHIQNLANNEPPHGVRRDRSFTTSMYKVIKRHKVNPSLTSPVFMLKFVIIWSLLKG